MDGFTTDEAPVTAAIASDTADTIHVRAIERADEEAWNAYVMRHPLASPFHLTAWRDTIRHTFGFEPLYRVAVGRRGICGVLPLFRVRNPLMGTVLLSSPFAVYGGVLADSAEVRDALKADIVDLARTMNVEYVELRNLDEQQCVGFHRLSRYVTFSQTLGGGEETLLQTIPRKTRAMVRKALKHDYTCVTRRYPGEAFIDLYLSNLQRLGTPAFPRKLFEELFQNFGNMVDVREYVAGGHTASVVLTFWFRDCVMPYYGASDPLFNALSPNNYMYFDLMRWGASAGYRLFDFGRSKKGVGGSYDFKAHWGMVERELPYEVLLVKRKTLPNFTPADSRFSLAGKLWSCLPGGVARAFGPSLVRLFP